MYTYICERMNMCVYDYKRINMRLDRRVYLYPRRWHCPLRPIPPPSSTRHQPTRIFLSTRVSPRFLYVRLHYSKTTLSSSAVADVSDTLYMRLKLSCIDVTVTESVVAKGPYRNDSQQL